MRNRPSDSISPYINEPQRLVDVISAIQAMATYKFYKLSFDNWSERITGDNSRGAYWRKVFEEHPEFFRLDGKKERASLVWRRQYPRRYSVDQDRTLDSLEAKAIPEDRISRIPLSPGDITALINAAIQLHARALEQQKETRWWIPLASAIGALVGSVSGALLKG